MFTRTVRSLFLIVLLILMLVAIPFSLAQDDPTPTLPLNTGDQVFSTNTTAAAGIGTFGDDGLGDEAGVAPTEPAPAAPTEAALEVTQEAVSDAPIVMNNTFIIGGDTGADTSADPPVPEPTAAPTNTTETPPSGDGVSLSFTAGELVVLVLLFVALVAIIVGVPVAAITYLAKNHAESLRQTPRIVSDTLASGAESAWQGVDEGVKASKNTMDDLIEKRVSEGLEQVTNKLLELMGSERRIDITDHNNAVVALSDATGELKRATTAIEQLYEQNRKQSTYNPSAEAIPQN